MRVEDCIVNVERRSIGGCADLAVAFCRQFIGPVYGLLFWFAFPSCAIFWLVSARFTDQLLWSVAIMLLICPLYSGALIAGIGPQVFGVPFQSSVAMKSLGKRLFAYTFLMVVCRVLQWLLMFCFVVPSLLLTAVYGHVAEVLLLEQSKVNDVPKRLGWLCGGGGFVRYFGHICWLGLLWLVFSLGIFLLLDFFSSTLFNIPILFGKVANSPDVGEAINFLLFNDRYVALTVHVSIWLTFPIIRLAWFFAYLDQRIRGECWDIDVKFRQEAVRLGGNS